MNKLNKPLFFAALLAAFTAGVHVVAGGQEVATPLLVSSLAETPRLVLYAVWHMVSIALALSAIALYLAGKPDDASRTATLRPMACFVSVLWLGFGFTFLAVAAIQPGEGLWLKLPQWSLLLPVGLLGLWGCAGNKMQ